MKGEGFPEFLMIYFGFTFLGWTGKLFNWNQNDILFWGQTPRRFGWIWVGKSNGATLGRNLRRIGWKNVIYLSRQSGWGLYKWSIGSCKEDIFYVLWGLVLLALILTLDQCQKVPCSRGLGKCFGASHDFRGYLTRVSMELSNWIITPI